MLLEQAGIGDRRGCRAGPARRERVGGVHPVSAQTGRRWPGLHGLAIANVIATALITPAGLHAAAARCWTPPCSRSAPR
ncbi:MAG: hypothetical protein R2734_20005 [Nocardioides sp.]